MRQSESILEKLLKEIKNEKIENVKSILNYDYKINIYLKINEKDNNGSYPLLYDTENNNEMVKLLIDYANKNNIIMNLIDKNNDGKYPLIYGKE